ncbi:MAG TPA: DUF1587 domain-containing protein, partial [Candidatus Nanopelagicales bacterium]|nr:DUF1587 domain-containing protein [Candidatus Nanopelagicales bacterium]
MGLQALHRFARRRWIPGLYAGALALALVAPGCAGTLGDDEGKSTPSPAQAPQSRFPRLSHAQWENTVRDLLRLDDVTGLSASFTGDPLGGVFDNNETALQVTPGLWADYQIAAEELSAMVTADPDLLAGILPTDGGADPDARARAFIDAFGRRVHRRPLDPGEVDRYAALFAGAAAILTDLDPFT